MLYLSGCVNHRLVESVGFMHTPMMGNSLYHGRAWAADTGCFSAPEKHDDQKYLVWLTRHADISSSCLFATAPDVVGDATATLALSREMLSEIRSAGFRSALVAQDGLEYCDIPWNTFDALFLGGTTRWKLGDHAAHLVRLAKSHGKWVHMGRVNSLRRLELARLMGCDSADGTFVAFSPDLHVIKVERWMRHIASRPLLFDATLIS